MKEGDLLLGGCPLFSFSFFFVFVLKQVLPVGFRQGRRWRRFQRGNGAGAMGGGRGGRKERREGFRKNRKTERHEEREKEREEERSKWLQSVVLLGFPDEPKRKFSAILATPQSCHEIFSFIFLCLSPVLPKMLSSPLTPSFTSSCLWLFQ